MKKIYSIIVLTTFLILAACGGSKLSVQKVPLTEPWTSINLPCNGEAVVIVADEQQFNCAYGGEWSKENDLKTITPYLEFLKNSGWKMTDQSKQGNSYLFEKNGKEIVLFPTSPYVHTDKGTVQWEGLGIQADYRSKVQ